MTILNFVSINRAILLALSVGLNISSIYAVPHVAQKPAHINRQLRIVHTSSNFVQAVSSGTLGIAELQKRFHPGDSSIKDPDPNDGPAFSLSTGEDGGSWKENIVATTFWIGEPTSSGSPSNTSSAWDSGWMAHYGGEDSPTQRVGGKPREGVTKRTDVLIVGEFAWPLLDDGRPSNSLARAKSYRVPIASERQFLQWLGKSAPAGQAKTYTADQLAALSKLPKEIVDQLSMFGLIEASNGLYGFRICSTRRCI